MPLNAALEDGDRMTSHLPENNPLFRPRLVGAGLFSSLTVFSAKVIVASATSVVSEKVLRYE